MADTLRSARPSARRLPDRIAAADFATATPGAAASARRRARAHRAGDAGAAQAAVAVGHLVEVLLVVVLGVVEVAGGRDLGRDLAEPALVQRALVALERGARGGRLLVVGGVDRRAVLGADVVALAHALRRVVALPEHLQQLVVRALRGVVDDQHGLGVAGAAAADLLVGGVRRVAAGVADGGGDDAGRLPEEALGAPEAAEREDRRARPLGERRLDALAVDGVALGNPRQRRVPPPQRPGGRHHRGRPSGEEHHVTVVPGRGRTVTREM